jgi:hypothetical protein
MPAGWGSSRGSHTASAKAHGQQAAPLVNVRHSCSSRDSSSSSCPPTRGLGRRFRRGPAHPAPPASAGNPPRRGGAGRQRGGRHLGTRASRVGVGGGGGEWGGWVGRGAAWWFWAPWPSHVPVPPHPPTHKNPPPPHTHTHAHTSKQVNNRPCATPPTPQEAQLDALRLGVGGGDAAVQLLHLRRRGGGGSTGLVCFI